MVETDFLSCGNRFPFFFFFFFFFFFSTSFFYGLSLKLIPHFFWKDFIPANRKGFSVQWKLFVFFYSVLLFCKSKPSVKLVKTKQSVRFINGCSKYTFFFNKKTIFCLSLNVLNILLEIRLRFS